MRKAVFAYSKNKGADKLCGNQMISAFIFNLDTVQSLFLLNSNFQAYSHLLCYTSEHAVNKVHELSHNVAEIGRLHHINFQLIYQYPYFHGW